MSVFPRNPRSRKIFNKQTVLIEFEPPHVVHLMQSSRPLCRLRGVEDHLAVALNMAVRVFQPPTCLYCIGVT